MEEYSINFEPPKISLKQLDEALEILSNEDDEEALSVVVEYILYDAWLKDINVSTDYICNKANILLTEYILNDLVQKGIISVSIDENGVAHYSAVSQG